MFCLGTLKHFLILKQIIKMSRMRFGFSDLLRRRLHTAFFVIKKVLKNKDFKEPEMGLEPTTY